MSKSLNVLKQPKPFYLIFFIEIWERFGFYGLQAVLAVYLVKRLGMSDANSFILFGAFSALTYGLVAVGGYIGDKILGTKRTITLGSLTLLTGYLLLTLSSHDEVLVYLALGTIATGNGLFKANPSALLAKCYEEGDSRLDGAFTMYYMAINLGSFVSMVSVPSVVAEFGWAPGFAVSAVGLFLGTLNYLLCSKWLEGYGSEADFRDVTVCRYIVILIGTVISCFLCAWLLQNLTVANALLVVVSVVVVFVMLKEIFTSSGIEQKKIMVAGVLMLEAIAFWIMYMQMPTAINFFTLKNVENSFLGFNINPLDYQALNPLMIMIFSPLLAMFYALGANRKKRMGMPAKFTLGMFLTALSFLVLPLGAVFANAEGIVSVGWLVLNYALLSMGELLISALGLSMVAQLLPSRLHGFIMGAWFLTTASAASLSGYIAKFSSVDTGGVETALDTLPVYSKYFSVLGATTLIVAVAMWLAVPWLTRMIVAKVEGGESEHDSVIEK